jgi:mono/diheme cytochrome c family protein
MFSLRKLPVLLALAAMLSTPLSAQESAQVAQGRAHYAEYCQMCHGADGKQGDGYQTPIWGPGTQIAKFGNAQGLLDYMQLMPFNDPSLLDDNQKLAVVAFMLANHGAMRPADTLDRSRAATLAIR